MRQRIIISLALALLLLCSCAASPGSSTTPSNPTRTTTTLTFSSVPTSAVSTTPSPTKAVSTPAATRATVPLSQKTPAPFRVTSVDMAATPASLTTWTCGSFIQVVYSATFHVDSGPSGGVIDFSYTLNNGRSQTPERLTIIAGQHLSGFVWTWQGALPADHTYPGAGGILVSSPNAITSQMVKPAGACR